jgi:glucoamylase
LLNFISYREEISATHFFTLLVSHRALTQGAALALRLSDPAASAYYALQASLISAKLELFWLPSPSSFLSTIDRALSGYIISTLDSPARFNRTGLDSGVLLAILKAGGEGEKGSWSVAGEKVLATVERYVRSFEGVYGINHEKNEEKWGGAIAVGRYAGEFSRSFLL